MAVAKKAVFSACRTFILYAFGGFALAFSLLGLQLGCMNKQQNSFVEKYCLSDNHSRAVVSAILTLTVWLIWTALVDVICAFRTAKLSSGIEEGAYVALGSMDYKYCWRCLKTRWCALIILLVLLSYGPGILQTVLSAVIQTVPVYVKSSTSTALIFDHTSYYNVTGVSMPAANLGTASGVLALLGQFALGGNSFRVQANHSVTTTLVRQGFISNVDIRDGDYSNAVQHAETSATVTTTCPPAQNLTEPFFEYLNSSTVMVSAFLGFSAYLYDLQSAVVASDHLVFYSTIVQCADCILSAGDPDLPQLAYMFTCTTDITLSTDDIIFTLGTQNIQKLPATSAATSVDALTFAELIISASTSIEAASSTLTDFDSSQAYNTSMMNLYSNFQQGLFNRGASNFMHSKLCAAAANALNLLWTNYGLPYDADGLPAITNGNNYTLYDTWVPVYSVVQQAYLPTKVSAAFAACLVLYIFLLSAIGTFYTARAHINVKSIKENSFFSSVDSDGVQDMIAAGASNCEDAQLDLAFHPNRVMYCSAESVMLSANSAPVERIKIGFMPGPAGVFPIKTTMYH